MDAGSEKGKEVSIEQKQDASKALRSSLLSSWGNDASVIFWLDQLQSELAKVGLAIQPIEKVAHESKTVAGSGIS